MVEKHPDTDNIIHDCSRCQKILNESGEPVEQNAVYYVTVPDESSPYIVDSGVAVKHTERTKVIRDSVVEKMGVDVERANAIMITGNTNMMPKPSELPDDLEIPDSWKSVNFDTGDELPVSVQKSEYRREKGVDPEIARLDDDVLKVIGDSAQIDGSQNIIICEGCLEERDEINWAGSGIEE